MDIGALRLHNQQIADTRLKTPEQVVAWMGGMQAQDYPGAKWSIGLRLTDSTDADVERASPSAGSSAPGRCAERCTSSQRPMCAGCWR